MSVNILYSGDSVTWGDELQWVKIMLGSGKDLVEENKSLLEKINIFKRDE